MSAKPYESLAYGLAAALVVASIAAACSLNPQPIPPGDQPDGSAGSANPTFGDADGGTKLSGDAGVMSTEAGIDTGAPPVRDAGNDGADALDAAADADAAD